MVFHGKNTNIVMYLYRTSPLLRPPALNGAGDLWDSFPDF